MLQIEILKQIKDLQLKADPKFFSTGLFPSYRKNMVTGLTHPDDNLFFSVSIVYILKSLYKKTNKEEQEIIDVIQKKLFPNIQAYTNNEKRYSFNFWKKQKNKHFPNGILANRINKFKLPDDIDTTSLTHLAFNFPYSKTAETKSELRKHANTINKTIQNGHKNIRKYQAYSTWFGENMPIEFDICVLSNLLLWLHHYNFDLNKYDKDTINLLQYSIEHSLYFKSPFKSAPEYPKAPVILYHLSRAVSQTPFLISCKDKLIADLSHQLSKTNNSFEKLILESSLLKLDKKTDQPQYGNIDIQELNHYWWFTAGFISVYSTFPLPLLAPLSLFHFRFLCPSFNLSLLYENMVLRTDNKNQMKIKTFETPFN